MSLVKKIRPSLPGLSKSPEQHIRRFKMLSRHPFSVPVITVAILMILTGGGLLLARHTNHLEAAADNQIVIISHDHQKQVVPSHEPTVGALLKELKLTLGQGDVVEPALNTPINQDQFRINIYRAKPVKIIDGSSVTYTFSAATTPRSIVQQAGKTVYPADFVSTDPVQNFIASGSIGEQVIIDRAVPVNLNLYGTPLTVRTHAKTVGDLIKQKGIKLAKDDVVTPVANTPLTSNAQVFITRNGTKIESITQAIGIPVQVIEDPTLAFGTGAIRQQGSAGQQVTTYQDQLQNGVVVSRTVIQTVVTVAPVIQIEVQGTSLSGIKGDMALAGIAASDYNYADYIISNESGWCPTKAQGEHTCPVVPDNQYTSGGYGLCQATPGSKMSSAGSDWATNPVTQLRWCSGYAHSRYGSWAAAYSHWVNYHNW